MKFRELFSVPEGKRITEKNLYRVLVSSICSILLCMGCLAGTTWAWFAVSIENEENVIQIEEPEVTVNVVRIEDPVVTVTIDDTFQSGYELVAGDYMLTITRSTNKDDLNQDMKFYASLIISYLDGEEDITKIYKIVITDSVSTAININTDFKLRIEISWMEPANAEPVVENLIEVKVEEETESTEESTEPTEETTEPTEAETEPTEETTQPTEAETKPTEETTQPTEAETDPTEETTQPTEAETDPIEETTQPAETETDPTEETTEPTEAETDSTEETTQATEAESEPIEETTEPTETETEAAETTVVTESNTDSSGNET